jgi:ribonucleotide monophosphatase NagD (HAD superfamily)
MQTPESDIRGTNEFDASGKASNDWHSILVKTGVYQDGTVPAYKPKVTVENVLDAVKYGMKREYEAAMKDAAESTPAIFEE